MPRSESPDLQSLFPVADVQSTAWIKLTSGTEYFLATTELSIGGQIYENKLKRVGEVRETSGGSVNNVQIQISNSDGEWGLKTASSLRLLQLADVEIKRFYASKYSLDFYQHKHIFTGKVVAPEAGQDFVTLQIVPDTTAAGTCCANRSLSPSCAWVFRGSQCGYDGPLLTCNLQLKSRSGCKGRNNTARFGGFAFPDNPRVSSPGSGGNETGAGTGVNDDSCFAAGTRIWTPYGERPIENMRQGFRHYSFNETTGAIEEDIVAEIFVHDVTEWIELHFAGHEALRVTAEHPFWHESYQWLRADQLKTGESVWHYTNRWHKSMLEGIALGRVNTTEPIKVYNFRSTKNPTYFANRNAVHNTKINVPNAW